MGGTMRLHCVSFARAPAADDGVGRAASGSAVPAPDAAPKTDISDMSLHHYSRARAPRRKTYAIRHCARAHRADRCSAHRALSVDRRFGSIYIAES